MLTRRPILALARAFSWRSLAAVCCAALLSGACDSLAHTAGIRREMRGLELDPLLEKPSFIAPSTVSDAFDFRKETDGKVTLLFFGYTYCPDICPVHMSNISQVLRDLSAADAGRIRVVFVTTDPERDTIERLRDWTASIDSRIIGVRPDKDEAIRLQSEVGIQPAMLLAPKAGAEGNYEVSHAAQIIAFTPDNRGRFAYAFGTRQADWAHDLPILLSSRWSK